MNFKNIKWPVVIITFIVAFGVFWGVHYLRQKQFVEEPLTQALESMEEVEKVQLSVKGGSMDIRLTVSKLADFPHFYETVEKAVSEIHKGDYDLIIEDAPDSAINAAYQKIHLALFEAIVQGNYVAMGEYIENVKDNHGLEAYRVVVTEDHVYLELENEGAFLYRRFVRQPIKGEETI